MKLIGLCGRAGSGKDFCADLIRDIASNYGFAFGKWAFADPVKANVYADFKGTRSLDEVFDKKPPDIRTALQQEGTENGRDKRGQEVWLLTAQAYIHCIGTKLPVDGLVFSDCRFLNEIEFVQLGGLPWCVAQNQLMSAFHAQFGDSPNWDNLIKTAKALRRSLQGGICLRIQSDRGTLQGVQAAHRSETEMAGLPDEVFDGIIVNNRDTTVDDLIVQLTPYVRMTLGEADVVGK